MQRQLIPVISQPDRNENILRGVVFFGLIGCMILYGIYEQKALVKNPVLTFGKIGDITIPTKSGSYLVAYSFQNKGKTFFEHGSIPYANWPHVHFLDSILRKKTFPVVYQKDNPYNCEMLFTKKDFERYKVDVPTEDKAIVFQIDSLLSAE